MARKTESRLNDTRTTPGDPRGVFYDLFPPDEAAELTIRAELLRGLEGWLKTAGTQTAAAKVLRVTQARVSDIKRGQINQFSLDLLERRAASRTAAGRLNEGCHR